MWAALTSDLQEFVSGVADEGSNVLSNMDSRTPQKSSAVIDPTLMLDGAVSPSSPANEVARLRNEETTFTEPLDEEDPEVREFLDAFDIEKKTDEIASLLKEYPETLQVQFDNVATAEDSVSYKDFWQRYYFRCDEHRIARHWEKEEEEKRRARAEAFSEGISTVKNLFGGAVKALSMSNDENKTDVVTPTFDYGAGSTAGMSFFGSSGRPPFVMNTAVDEDDDDDNEKKQEEEEEEEEEELGWDDDDDDDDEEEEETLGGKEDEEITFSGGNDEYKKLQDRLQVAVCEREQLRHTVEMQGKEIATLKTGVETPTAAGVLRKEIESLRMQLFEKDAELAALKSTLEDTHDDPMDESSKKRRARITSLEMELAREVKSREEAQSQLAQATKTASQQATELKKEVASLKQQLDDKKDDTLQELKACKDRVAQLEKDLEATKKAPAKEEHSDTTSSTGVKVEGSGPAKASDDDDGWGDDW